MLRHFQQEVCAMHSTLAHTDEIDDLREAAQEIFEQTADFEFGKNSLAIVMCEDETDYRELYLLLSEKWKFDFIGCTAMAMLQSDIGYCGTGISVMLLTADDCSFAAGITDTLTTENYKEEIAKTYRNASETLDEKEKMIISYSVIVTSEDNVPGDAIVGALDEASGHIPVFGGLASDGFNFTESRVFFNERIEKSGVVMALISGNIKPVWVTMNSIESRSSFTYEITESEGNQIFRLGNNTFMDALRKAQFKVDKTDVFGDYLISPFVLTVKMPGGEEVDVARNISVLNHEKESGIFLGGMPQGSYVGIGTLNRDDVQNSVEKALSELINKVLRESGYEYKTFICTTCVARFLALASNLKAEGNLCMKYIPKGSSLLGMYSYGEFCPVKGSETGADYNMFHNMTFTTVAF